mmetsp:Transcript_10605/g.35967  ORF Transcript_10605/g.35967 Transcript_10605/m.35967 type:complete len:351 (-) Transcript_10605:2172-3224(-)
MASTPHAVTDGERVAVTALAKACHDVCSDSALIRMMFIGDEAVNETLEAVPGPEMVAARKQLLATTADVHARKRRVITQATERAHAAAAAELQAAQHDFELATQPHVDAVRGTGRKAAAAAARMSRCHFAIGFMLALVNDKAHLGRNWRTVVDREDADTYVPPSKKKWLDMARLLADLGLHEEFDNSLRLHNKWNDWMHVGRVLLQVAGKCAASKLPLLLVQKGIPIRDLRFRREMRAWTGDIPQPSCEWLRARVEECSGRTNLLNEWGKEEQVSFHPRFARLLGVDNVGCATRGIMKKLSAVRKKLSQRAMYLRMDADDLHEVHHALEAVQNAVEELQHCSEHLDNLLP